MTLHGATWVWGGTIILALFALALLYMIHGQAKVALSLLLGAHVIGILVWLLATSFRRAYPPDAPEDDRGPSVLDRLSKEE
jgi:hypothetical protein